MATAPDELALVGLRAESMSRDRPSRVHETEIFLLAPLPLKGPLPPQQRGGKMTDPTLSPAPKLGGPSGTSGRSVRNSFEWHSLRVFGRGRGRVYFEAGGVDLKLNGGCAVWRDGFDAHRGGWPS